MTRTLSSRLELSRRDLLDLGLRNALVNHPARAKQVRVVDERSAEVFRLLVRERRAMSFAALPDKAVSSAIQSVADPAARVEELDWDARLARPGDGEGGPAERHQDRCLQTALTADALAPRLLGIHNDARTYVEEQGVNILFLALGFLHWYESASSAEPRRAPLVLVPVELSRPSVGEKFQLRCSEGGEIGENLSLAEKLRAEFNLRLPPMGDIEEFDPATWFRSVAEVIADAPRWAVKADEIALGFFSFGKFLMYRDLDPRVWEGTEPSPLLGALLGEGFRELPPAVSETDHIDRVLQPADVRQVKDADSSQVLAILDVLSGRNLVLQGPPGTGKSQTITNIIAECIGAGRKVLFVAEKMAALDVVKRRLDECGLAGAVLELHSHKTNKKLLLEELGRTLHAEGPRAARIDDDVALLTRLRDELNTYCEAVNAPVGATQQSFVMALGKAIEAAGGREPGARLAFAPMETWTDAVFREHRLVVEAMDRHLAQAGAPADSPFPQTGLMSFLPSQREALAGELAGALDATRQLHTIARALAGEMSLPPPADFAAATALAGAARRALAAPPLHGVALDSPEWLTREADVQRLLAAGRYLADVQARYAAVLIESAWQQDLVAVRQAWVTRGRSWWRFLSGEFRSARARLQGLLRGELPRDVDAVVGIIDAVLDSQVQRRHFAALSDLGQSLFGEQWRAEASDWIGLDATAAWVVALRRDIAAGSLPAGITTFLARPRAANGVADALAILEDLLPRHAAAATSVGRSLALPLEPGQEHTWGLGLEAQRATLQRWIDGLLQLDARVRFNVLAAQLDASGLSGLAARCVAWREPAGELTRLLDCSWYTGLVEKGYADSPAIARFDRVQHELSVERFAKLDQLLFQHNRVRLALAHWQQLPSLSGGGEMALLAGEMNKKRRILPIRVLMEKAGRAIQAIKPVFMMGPMSVATYLPPGAVAFDLVVFDEASQVRPVDAFGALMRGSQAVVVGDSKQLPPTSFFDTLVQGEETDEENDDALARTGDMESILSLFLARGAPERMLRWHYRSRHHSLIAVSNHEFYDGRLVVFPSPGTGTKARGLRLVHCPETVYDRGRTRTNPGEARRVAEAVMQHARDYPDLSLGVVSFSVAQRDAIEQQLELLRRARVDSEPFFSEERLEPFFVKNLENVQGDERDVIFISVGYGRAEKGYMPMNFGPLNRDGGERRLNVLISRSRLAMDVFCNFRAEELDLARSNARALVSLRNFLSYAERGQLETTVSTGREPDSAFEQAVLRALAAHGHAVEPQVGSAGFFIDIGVRDPELPGRYLLGIECDGATYHSSRSARDRDRLRQQVLEGLGWRLHRIWSTDWYRNPQRELERALVAIENARTVAVQPAPESPSAGLDTPVAGSAGEPGPVAAGDAPEPAIVPPLPSRELDAPVPYVRASLSIALRDKQLHELNTAALAAHVAAVVETESPVHPDDVARRITEAAGLKRTGQRIQEAVAVAVAHAERSGKVLRRGDFLWWPAMQEAPVRDRSAFESNHKKIELIAPEEIAAAIRREVARGFSMDVESAITAAARSLGFLRLAASSRGVMLGCVHTLVAEGALKRSGDTLQT